MNVIDAQSTGVAVIDVQQRLMILGFDLNGEAGTGVFGPYTQKAVAAFREAASLGSDTVVDKPTWAALVNATFMLGERVLYLRMPYFHGSDVHTLQTALAALGFSCLIDGIFGAYTEHAVREFQANVGLAADGIVGNSSFEAIERLRHAWHDKNALTSTPNPLGFARAAKVLEDTSICIFGVDNMARRIAERISNLALATTASSKVTSAQRLSQAPQDSMLMVGLSCPDTPGIDKPPHGIPHVLYDSDDTLPARLRTAIESTPGKQQQRVMVELITAGDNPQKLTTRQQQHHAIALLDAICLAYS
jgi:peptidoglycan hydrolase-like protein with peptidoglycan-binding domain